MTRQTLLPPQPPNEPVRRVEAGPWAIELLPGAAYEARYIATQAAVGFAFDSQRGVHAIASDRLRPFDATPNSLAFVPMGCDVFSASGKGGEYLRLIRTDGVELAADQPFNNRVDPQAMALAQRMRAALLRPSATDDWQEWAQALAARVKGDRGSNPSSAGVLADKRLRLLDEFIDAGLGEPLSVQDMAQLLDLSEGFFTRACKETMGKSPHSYLIDRRLCRARDLLRDPARSLSDIALACGFASQAHMATVFKQRLGVSPSELRSSR